MNSCCTAPKFRSLFKMQEIYQTGLWKNEIRSIYRKNEWHSFCTVIFSNGFQLFLQLSTRSRSAFFSFYPSLFRQQQPFLKMSLLRSRWLKMVSPTIPRQKKLSEAEIHFCSSRRLFFNNPPGHIQLHLKMNCSSSWLGIYIDTSTENIQETLPFIFLFRIPENTGKAHIYQGERKMNSSRRHPPNFFNMASIVKKKGNFFSFFRIPPLHFSKLAFCEKKRKRQQEAKITPFFEN